MFAVDRANIRSVGPTGGGGGRNGYAGFGPWEYYGFKVSRGPTE